jgi:hypothetical protein
MGTALQGQQYMSTTVAPLIEARSESRYFYLYLAGAFILIAFGGFIPTYWAPVTASTFKGPPILHIHGALLFSWTVFYFVQTAFVAGRRIMDHRAWGLAGIALFSVLMCSILVAQMMVLKRDDALGHGDASRRFAAVTLCAWPVMAVFFTLAIVNIRKPEVHKRLMTLLLINMMTPALARVFLVLLAATAGSAAAAGGPPPPFVAIPPSLVGDLFLVVAIVHDWRTRGRPHPVYVYGGLVTLGVPFLIAAFAKTEVWMSMAKAFERLAG